MASSAIFDTVKAPTFTFIVIKKCTWAEVAQGGFFKAISVEVGGEGYYVVLKVLIGEELQ